MSVYFIFLGAGENVNSKMIKVDNDLLLKTRGDVSCLTMMLFLGKPVSFKYIVFWSSHDIT